MIEGVGTWVRRWRERRRLSQAELADQAEVSPRHLSCIERGRSRPSRQMVLVLASVLEVPLRERNVLLRAAGFAPIYQETELDEPRMAQVRLALELMLRHAEPYPAVVLDRAWNVVLANDAWRLFSTALVGSPPVNLLRATFDPDGLRPWVDNWDEVARALLDRLRREAALDGDEALVALHAALSAELPPDPDWTRPLDVVLPLRIRLGENVLSLFTTLTTLGTPADVTLSELCIEQYHPADEATDRFVRAWRAELADQRE